MLFVLKTPLIIERYRSSDIFLFLFVFVRDYLIAFFNLLTPDVDALNYDIKGTSFFYLLSLTMLCSIYLSPFGILANYPLLL